MNQKKDFQQIISDCVIIDGKIFVLEIIDEEHPCRMCDLKSRCRKLALDICTFFGGYKRKGSMVHVGDVDFSHLDEKQTPTLENAKFYIY